ncbi:MAG: ABC transporter permease [Lachnospiraceae bacterium]|nr:ABC transporter permease [Lachnospiraceae bacterium]
MRLFQSELKKIRRRHIGLIYIATFLAIFMWMAWAMGRMDAPLIASQGYYYMLLSLPLMNSIFLPTLLACAESRICDIELKGNTFKALCTMQPRHSIYHIKLLFSALYLLFFTLAETALIPALCSYYHVLQPVPAFHIGAFFFSTYFVSLILSVLQQSLSLLSENQLFPLFVGVGGTFVGIFTAFFPNLPVCYLLPWGYYHVVSTINMDYDNATRLATYYTIPFPWAFFLGFLTFGILIYLAGLNTFIKKEV